MKEKVFYPDYSNSILGIPNSILKYCGVEPLHKTNDILDRYLKKEYQNVVFMLFDGMGTECIEKNLDKDNSLFIANKRADLSSVFLSTTTAATTSLVSALSPIEHGWLGWSCYFSEIGKLINIYINDDGEKSDNIPVADYIVAEKYMPFRSVFEIINEQSKEIEACSVSKFGTVKIQELDELFQKTKELCSDDKRRYIYTYWGDPDGVIHYTGCDDYRVKWTVMDIEKRVAQLAKNTQNTLFIVSADHGLTDCSVHAIEDYPEIESCLRLPIALEPRCISFYIKEGMTDEFVRHFKKHFADKFILYTKDEFIQNGFLGPGQPHTKSMDFVGDIVAVAVDDTGIWYRSAHPEMYKGMHAGMTEKEMKVPLIIFESET